MDDRTPPPDKPKGSSRLSPVEIRRAIFGGIRLAWLDRKAKFEARADRAPKPDGKPEGRVVELRPKAPPSTNSVPMPTLFRPLSELTREQRLKIIEDQEAAEVANPRNPKVPTPFPVDD